MPDQEPTAPVGARDELQEAIYPWVMASVDLNRAADAILASLRAKGLVIVGRDDVEMAVEWMDQTTNPWSGHEAFQETYYAGILAHDALKDALTGGA